MRNAVSNKGEPRKILGGKNLTVARATFATVWIRAWAEHWASIPKVVGSIPTVVRHIFQACPVWI